MLGAQNCWELKDVGSSKMLGVQKCITTLFPNKSKKGILKCTMQSPMQCFSKKHKFYTTNTTLTANVMTTCDPPFVIHGSGCYYIEDTNIKDWTDAEAHCQTYGNNVHLAGMETAQVIQLHYTLTIK